MKPMAGSLVALSVVLVVTSNARADDVTDWNETMLRAGLVAGSSPLVMTRNAAMVQAAVFDAVNGVDPRYTSIHVDAAGPAGASRRAAAVQAAYAILTKLYGSGAATPNAAQQANLDARRTVCRPAAAHEQPVHQRLQRSEDDGQRRERGSNTRPDHVFVVLEFSDGHLPLESRHALSHRIPERRR